MKNHTLLRGAGIAGILSGLLVLVGTLLHPEETAVQISGAAWAISHILLLVSLILGLLAVTGLYVTQSREAGTMGALGYLLAFAGMVLFVGIVYFEALINPVLVTEAPAFINKQVSGELGGPLTVVLPITGLLFSAGWLGLGLAWWRAGIFPRWATVLTIIGAVPFGVSAILPMVVSQISGALFGLGLVGLGYALWIQHRAGVPNPTPHMTPA